MTHAADAAPSGRISSLDGLRGIAVILVVLSHGWTVYPFAELENIGPFRGLFLAGDIGVTVFFVVSGFVVTRATVSTRNSQGPAAHWWTVPRRLARSFPQLALLMAAIVVLNMIDTTDESTRSTTTNSAFRILTYTWNWYLLDNPLGARADLGHLWYLSVELQVVVALALAVTILGASQPRRLLIILLVALAFITLWRWHIWDAEGWYSAGLRTTTRADGLLYGAATALAVPLAPDSLRRQAGAISGGALLVLAGTVLATTSVGLEGYYKFAGTVANFACALLVGSLALLPTASAARPLQWRPLVVLGTASLTIYIWHYPALWALSRHSADWRNLSRVIVGVALVAAISVVVHRYVDMPALRWSARLGRPKYGPPGLGSAGGDGQPAQVYEGDRSRRRRAIEDSPRSNE